MTKRFTQGQIEERFQKLPDALKEAIFSVEIAEKVFDIGKNNGLTVEKIGILAEEGGYLILGLIHPEEFSSALKERLGVSQDIVQKIAHSMNQEIFLPLRQSEHVILDKPAEPAAKKEEPPAFAAKPAPEQKLATEKPKAVEPAAQKVAAAPPPTPTAQPKTEQKPIPVAPKPEILTPKPETAPSSKGETRPLEMGGPPPKPISFKEIKELLAEVSPPSPATPKPVQEKPTTPPVPPTPMTVTPKPTQEKPVPTPPIPPPAPPVSSEVRTEKQPIPPKPAAPTPPPSSKSTEETKKPGTPAEKPKEPPRPEPISAKIFGSGGGIFAIPQKPTTQPPSRPPTPARESKPATPPPPPKNQHKGFDPYREPVE